MRVAYYATRALPTRAEARPGDATWAWPHLVQVTWVRVDCGYFIYSVYSELWIFFSVFSKNISGIEKNVGKNFSADCTFFYHFISEKRWIHFFLNFPDIFFKKLNFFKKTNLVTFCHRLGNVRVNSLSTKQIIQVNNWCRIYLPRPASIIGIGSIPLNSIQITLHRLIAIYRADTKSYISVLS